MNISDIIKKERKKKNLTQKELAKLIGKSERMLQKYENGEVVPSLEVLNAIGAALGIFLFDFSHEVNSFSVELITSIEKAYVNKFNGNRIRDILQVISDDLELDYDHLLEVIEEKDKELPASTQIKLLNYLSDVDYPTFLNFYSINKNYPYLSEVKEAISKIMFSKLSEVETTSFLSFKRYLSLTFGEKVTLFTDDELETLKDDVDQFLEFALYKMEKDYYEENEDDKDT